MSGLAVVGSANLDLVVATSRVPAAGETVLGREYQEFPGGKGFNQAVAAAPLARSSLVCAWGDDGAATTLDAALKGADVDVRAAVADAPTGRALILLSAGDNRIVVAPGANGTLSASHVRRALDDLNPAVVSAMFEVPLDAVDAAALWAAAHRVRFVLNASPVPAESTHLPLGLLAKADPLVVNRGEAQALLRVSRGDGAELAVALTAIARSVVLTDGPRGSWYAEGDDVAHAAARSIVVADTTGGGDSLAGTLAACFVDGAEPLEALRIATDAATDLVATARADRP